MYKEIRFAERGLNVQLYPYVVFVNPEQIHLKSEIIVSEFSWLHGGLKTMIGNFIHLASYTSIAGGGVCILEDFVGVSAGCRIITGSEMIRGEGLTNPTIPRAYRAVSRSFVHLERHAFLASNVVVHPGVTIGEGAVVGSNSVVSKNIEPWTINVGIPARAIGKRQSETIKRLEDRVYREKSVDRFDATELLNFKVTHESRPDEALGSPHHHN
jgi:galactoside O-acetyltransferase